MEVTTSISIIGVLALLILSLLFLLLISFRLNIIDINVFDIEGVMARKIRFLKERIEALERALKIK